jgi:predicted DNA-binding protein
MKPKLLMRINFYLTKAQVKRLKDLSKKTGLPVSEHVRRGIDEYIERQKKGGGKGV